MKKSLELTVMIKYIRVGNVFLLYELRTFLIMF